MEKIHVSVKSCWNFKKSLFVLFNATAKSVNCSIFSKNLEKHFSNLTYKTHSKFTQQHLSKKFIGDNSSITDIALKNGDLSIIGIVQSCFEIIDYRYRLRLSVQKSLSCPLLLPACSPHFPH